MYHSIRLNEVNVDSVGYGDKEEFIELTGVESYYPAIALTRRYLGG